MFDHAWELAGVAARAGLVVPVVTALILVVSTLAAIRGGKSVAMARTAVVLALLSAGWLALDQLERRDLAAERRALDTRAFDLAVRAIAPGSALACLGAMAGEMVEKSCEKALFASSGNDRRRGVLCRRAALAIGRRRRICRSRGPDHRHGNATARGRGRSIRDRGARARSPGWLHARSEIRKGTCPIIRG
jgi:hypothetical protein